MALAALSKPFGALQSMLSQQTIRHLSNATATWWPGGHGVGAPVPALRAIHDREQGATTDTMVNDFNPVASLLAQDVVGIRRGDALQFTLDGASAPGSVFQVERAHEDGRGLVVVELSTL